jgi:hypothetical protein
MVVRPAKRRVPKRTDDCEKQDPEDEPQDRTPDKKEKSGIDFLA